MAGGACIEVCLGYENIWKVALLANICLHDCLDLEALGKRTDGLITVCEAVLFLALV